MKIKTKRKTKASRASLQVPITGRPWILSRTPRFPPLFLLPLLILLLPYSTTMILSFCSLHLSHGFRHFSRHFYRCHLHSLLLLHLVRPLLIIIHHRCRLHFERSRTSGPREGPALCPSRRRSWSPPPPSSFPLLQLRLPNRLEGLSVSSICISFLTFIFFQV